MKKFLVVLITIVSLNLCLYTTTNSKALFCGKALAGCLTDCGTGDLFSTGCKVGCALGYAMC